MNTTHNSTDTDIFAPLGEGETEFATTPVKTGRSLRKPVLVGAVAAAVVVAMLAGGGVAMAAHKDVTGEVDGQVQELGTFSGSVEGALDSAGVTIGERDTVAPGAGHRDLRRLADRRREGSPAHPDHRRPDP